MEGGINRATLDPELDNWREAVNLAGQRRRSHAGASARGPPRAAAVPETGRWTASALTVDGILDLPARVLVPVPLAVWTVTSLDYAALAASPWRVPGRLPRPDAPTPGFAPFDSVLAIRDGRDPVEVIEAALATPGLSPVSRATLIFYRALYRNLPPATDIDAAHEAVPPRRRYASPVSRSATPSSPWHYGEDDPAAAMEALRRGQELAERTGDSFIIASTSAWGSLVTLGLPTEDRRREHLNWAVSTGSSPSSAYAEATLLTLGVCVLRRADHPAAAPLHAYLFATPTGVTVARSIAPDLPDPEPTANAPTTFEGAIAPTRATLSELA